MQLDYDQTVHHYYTESSSQHNGLDRPSQASTANSDQTSRSSLLKSMLTCPMSSINSPKFDDYQLVFNDDQASKQEDSSEIRKMLSEPPKSGSPVNNPKPSSSAGSSNPSPLLQNALFASSARPRASSSASALLRQLGSLSHLDRNPPSHFSMGQSSHKPHYRSASFGSFGVENSKSSTKKGKVSGVRTENSKPSAKKEKVGSARLENPKQSAKKERQSGNKKRSIKVNGKSGDNYLQGVEAIGAAIPKGEQSHAKAKAIEAAVGNFSQFLHNTMSKHDFSADQMNFIMESAIKSASKVITETAKKSNVSENLRATATNFIENAIGNAIKTESMRHKTKKVIKETQMFLNKSGTETQPQVTPASKSLKSGKPRTKTKKPKVVEDKDSVGQNKPKKRKKKNSKAKEMAQQAVNNDSQDIASADGQLLKKKRPNPDIEDPPYFEDQLSVKKAKFENINLPYFEDQLAHKRKSSSVEIDNQSEKIITVKCEPEDTGYEQNYYSEFRGLESDDTTVVVKTQCNVRNGSSGDIDSQSEKNITVKCEPEDTGYEQNSYLKFRKLELSDTAAMVETPKEIGHLHSALNEKSNSPYYDNSDSGKENKGSSTVTAAMDTESDHVNDNRHSMGQNTDLSAEAKHQERNQEQDLDMVVDEHTIKIEPGVLTEDNYALSVEDKRQSTNRPVCLEQNDFVKDFIREEVKKGLKEPVGGVSLKFENSFDKDDKSTSQPTFTCETCGQEFEHKGTLKVHQRGHNFKSKAFQCSICGKCVTDSSYLKIHMKTHQGELAHTEPCDNEVSEESAEPSKESFECDICHLQFSNFGNYQIHHRMHSGEKLFKCEECGTGFTRKSQLAVHMGIHTGEKPYSCKECGMKFRQNGGLRLHMLVHTDDKPQKCPFCPASFSRKAHLEKHIRYHSGSMPFVCQICNKAFVDKELLKQHMKTVHPDGKPGKRGVYQRRSFPDQFPDKLGPKWRGFVPLTDEPNEEADVPRPCFPCGVCGETFDQITVLVEHLETHNNPEPTITVTDTPVTDTSEVYSKSDNIILGGLLNSQNKSMSQPNGGGHSFSGTALDKLSSEIIKSLKSPLQLGEGVFGSPGIGVDALKIERNFKCPFCDESFDLPGPRIRHIHQEHPIKNPMTGLESSDENYLFNRHMIEDRTVNVMDLYDLKSKGTEIPALNTNTGVQPIKLEPGSVTDTQSFKVLAESLSQSFKLPIVSNTITPHSNTNTPKSITNTQNSVLDFSINNKTVVLKPENAVAKKIVTNKGQVGETGKDQGEEKKGLWCPYCDRVYQRQSSRTRHINETHREMKDTYRFLKELKERQQR